MQVSVANSDAGLAALWPDWATLWQRAPGAWPFGAPAWMMPWWRAFGTGFPVVALLHGPLGLCGVLPLYRRAEQLLPMGVGISDYFDVLLAPEAPPGAAADLLAAALAAAEAPRCDLPDLPEAARLLGTPPPAGWHGEPWDGPACPVLPLAPEPSIPKTMRRDLRQARNRAGRAGGWSVERADAETLPGLLDALIRLHASRWGERGEPGVLADRCVLGFHRDAAPRLLQAGLLRLEALRMRGRVAAVIHALLMPGAICFYLAGFDPAAAFESPGTILLGHMIETAAQEGRQEAHFLRGDEAYKYAWGGIARRNTGRSFRRA